MSSRSGCPSVGVRHSPFVFLEYSLLSLPYLNTSSKNHYASQRHHLRGVADAELLQHRGPRSQGILSRFVFAVARTDRTVRRGVRMAGQSRVACRLGIFLLPEEIRSRCCSEF